MSISNHVVSLELSQELDRLGVRRPSEFWWHKDIYGGWCVSVKERGMPWVEEQWECYPAYLSSELGEMLKPNISIEATYYLTCQKLEGPPTEWVVTYSNPTKEGWFILNRIGAKIEVNARAKMLIYLLINNLVSLDEVNGGSDEGC